MDIDEISIDICNQIIKNNGFDVLLINTENKSNMFKRMIVCSTNNNQQAKTLAEILKEINREKIACLHADGTIKGQWITLDFSDILVQIFTKESRLKYNVEKLWKDGKNCMVIKNIM